MALTQSTPSPTRLDAYMAKCINAPTWEPFDASSVGDTAVSEDRLVSDERHTPYNGAYIVRETSRWAFAQNPIRHSATNEVFCWPPPSSSSPPFRFNPFGDSKGPTAAHIDFVPAPVPQSLHVPGQASLALYSPDDTIYIPTHRQREWVAIESADVDEPVAYPSPITSPQIIHREPSTCRQTPACRLAHDATFVGSQPNGATPPSLYEDVDDLDDFVLCALRLPWFDYNLIDVDETTPPSTPSSTPPLSPSTLRDDDEDLPVLEKEEEMRGWEEASPLARRDAIYQAAF
ncbi:unnamed protein product [Somion occarium]|uniref:Uncharacterized protein n=1 Tax=Somion occarium TaxID=3059160 RepID=A0ABP1DBJ8_9APHY